MAKKSKGSAAKSKKKNKSPGKDKSAGQKKPSARSLAVEELQSRLKQLSLEIERVGEQASKAIVKTEQESQRILQELDNKRAAAQEELNQLVDKGGTAFRDLSSGFGKAVDDLEQAIKKAFGRFS